MKFLDPKPTDLLSDLLKQLSTIQFDYLTNVDFWFYRPNCLVMDFRVDNSPVAMDFVDDTGRIMVKLMGRDEKGRAMVRSMMRKTGLAERSGRFYLPSISAPADGMATAQKVARLLMVIQTRAAPTAE